MAGTACTAPTGSAPPTHAESELVEEAGEAAPSWPGPARAAGGCSLIRQRLLPGRPKESDTSWGRGSLCPAWSVEGREGREEEGWQGLPHPGSRALQTHTQTRRGACRPPWDSCPQSCWYFVTETFQPAENVLVCSSIKRGLLCLRSLPTPMGSGCELVILQHTVPAELSWSTEH